MNYAISRIMRGTVFLVAVLLAACGGGAVDGDGNTPGNPAPTVSSTYPANQDTGVKVNSAITATFSEPVTASTVSSDTFILSNGVTGNVSCDGLTATFIPASSLASGTAYTAIITTGVKSADGTAMASNYQWTFTTGATADTTPPTVSSTNPVGGATGIATNASISATFSEPMTASTLTNTTFTLNNGVTGTVTYSGTTATFTPSSALANSTTYTATISTGVRDAAGNAMTSARSWTFTTSAAADTIPPTVSSTNPASGATGIATNASISATFSEPMTVSTLTTTNFTLMNGTTSVAGAVNYSGTTATFTPSSALANSTTYTATISTGVRDAAGNAMTSARSWTFTTSAAADTTPPTVSSTSPANNATGIATNAAIIATFSEAMTASTLTTANFTLMNGTTSVAGAVTYSGTTATFTPLSALANSATYTATLSTGVRDVAGNAMTSARTWTFTTSAAADTTPPTVSSTNPASGATGIATNAAISATFSEPMTASTLTTANFTLMNGTTSVAGAVNYSGTTATFTPSSALANGTTYTATISTGVRDAAGNAMASNRTWAFTTQTAPAPGTVRIVFLHHSTGGVIYWGGSGANVEQRLTTYNSAHGTDYQLVQTSYPNTGGGYPWENYPYDYWNLWINHTGTSMDRGELNLDMLAANYDVIVFKHCYPASSIEADTGVASVSSPVKSLQNYKLQYAALKARMLQFPNKKFILWTGAARRADDPWITPAQAVRAKEFFDWVKTTWDVPGDNIFVWDFFALETNGNADGYLLDANSAGPGNSHPNNAFATVVTPYFVQRMVDVIEGRGDSGSITGQ